MTELQKFLQAKLASGLYNVGKIMKDTEISRHWLNNIKSKGEAPAYILVALNDYFKKLGD